MIRKLLLASVFLLTGMSVARAQSAFTTAGLSQGAPVGGNVAITTTAATAIAAALRTRWSYQVQGTGWACASWVTTSVTIAVSSANVATCGGAGAFRVADGSTAVSQPGAIPTTPLTVIGAAPAGGSLALSLAWDAQ